MLFLLPCTIILSANPNFLMNSWEFIIISLSFSVTNIKVDFFALTLFQNIRAEELHNWFETLSLIAIDIDRAKVQAVAPYATEALVLIWPGATLKVAAIALGAYFVVSGVVRIVTAIVELGLPGGWRVLDILIGLMLAVGGVAMLKNAALSGATLAVLVTMVVGLGWMLEGVMALVESWRMPSSAWAVIYALLSIVAGFIVLFSPISSTTWLILFGGCALVAIGIVAIVRAFTFGKPKRK